MGRAFHAALHALPRGEIAESTSVVDRRPVKQLILAAESLDQSLPVSFEDAFEQLASLPRMFIEPDGSFVWVSDTTDVKWQLDGMMFDRGGRLQYVEMRGTCTPEAFDRFADIFRIGETQFAIQLMQQAIFLSEDEFRRYVFE